jgi:hypothetical protein
MTKYEGRQICVLKFSLAIYCGVEYFPDKFN